eukprot:TRINITY_DN16412_c0_g1_i1.p3 TRINITY_DN16412_c0_g1~~TRINITY_DN16412_c0_g1_i1.p3  ORF type:complete len:50 (-),score=9.87 TRINITY_DN16412_c0_g1_i1:290-439(-)
MLSVCDFEAIQHVTLATLHEWQKRSDDEEEKRGEETGRMHNPPKLWCLK